MGDQEYKTKVAISSEAVLDETGINLAFIRADTENGEISMHWLPELFSRPVPPAVKQAIVEKLRFHADQWENGDMERRMQKYVGINNPGNRSKTEQ